MNTTAQQPALRDIHLPDTVPWWPPAPGWWLLAVSCLLLAYIAWHLLKRRKQKRLQRLALEELAQIETAFQSHQDKGRVARELSTLLRRVCISRYPRIDTAALTGKPWLEFLDKHWKKPASLFNDDAGQALLSAPYQANPEFDADSLLNLCRQWLHTLPARNPTHIEGAT